MKTNKLNLIITLLVLAVTPTLLVAADKLPGNQHTDPALHHLAILRANRAAEAIETPTVTTTRFNLIDGQPVR